MGRPQSIGEDPVNLAVNNRQSTVLKKEGQLGATKDSVTLDVGNATFNLLWRQDFSRIRTQSSSWSTKRTTNPPLQLV